MCFDNTSNLLATASSDFTTKIWDIKSQYCTHNLKGAQAIVKHVKFYPIIQDKQQCVTGCDGGKLRVYDLNSSKMDACLDAHFSSITCIDYIKNGSAYDRLLSGSRDKVLIIWDLNTLTKQRTIPIYESIESFLLLSSSFLSSSAEIESRYVITMGNEGVLKLWDIKTGHSLFRQGESDSLKILNKRLSKEYADLELVIVQAVFNKATNTIVLVTADQLIVFVRLNVGLIEAKLAESAEKLDFQADGLFETYKQYIGDHGEILDTQVCNASENLLAMATNNEFLKIYNLDNWDCKLLKGHTDLIICLAACVDRKNPRLSYLASSSKDTTIRLWRIEEVEESEGHAERGVGYKYECVSVCNGHTQDVGALCFSKLGVEFLVSGSIDTTIKLWKLKRISQVSTKNTSIISWIGGIDTQICILSRNNYIRRVPLN